MQRTQILESLTIIDIAEEGKGVAKYDDLVIFIDKGVPGDIVDVQVVRKKKKFAEARIIRIVTLSPYRVSPFCEHFGVCGGCKWQQMSYEAQLKYKGKTVLEVLQRIGGVSVKEVDAIVDSKEVQYYRNKLEFTFSNKRWLTDKDEQIDASSDMNALGFHVPLRFDKILDIQHCYLQGGISNALRNEVRNFALTEQISFYDLRLHEGALRNLIIRTSTIGETMVMVVFAHPKDGDVEKLMAHISVQFPEITSLFYIINQKKNDTIFDQETVPYKGLGYILEEMSLPDSTNKIRFKISPKSFYQTNSRQAEQLYRMVYQFANVKDNELVYDLYTGAGTIANYIAHKAKKVVGIEYVPDAILDAKENSRINGISNTLFFSGDMKDVLTDTFVVIHGKPDVIITDPPRAGMHEDVVKRILNIEAKRIVYVSCNVATQARDLVLLKEKYDIQSIQPVDMFPQTQHIENIALLVLKSTYE